MLCFFKYFQYFSTRVHNYILAFEHLFLSYDIVSFIFSFKYCPKPVSLNIKFYSYKSGTLECGILERFFPT